MKAAIRKIISVAAICLCLSGQKAMCEDTNTGVFNERIRTLQVGIDGYDISQPIITLDGDDRVKIAFDHLADDREYLRYELVHCNANWQPSGLVDSEFLDGFNLGTIDDYRYSNATTVRYVHYQLCIPNQDVAPMISGNYLVKIYPEDDPQNVWLQCRFMVSEQTAPIEASVTSRTDVDYNQSHQQLSISVDTERSGVRDPFNDLTVVVQQNSRIDNERVLRQPMRMQGRSISVYEHVPALIFDAGNEYRRFENVSVTYPTMGVEEISYAYPYYHFTLATDEPRADKPYSYDQTQFGRYVVREYNSPDSDVDADYGVVHFTLDMPYKENAMVFIDSDVTQRRFEPESMMTYNRATGLYERNMLLKQGAYNYQYLVVEGGKRAGSTAMVEGDNYQTINEYLIKVYTRQPGDRYDRLIGVSTIYSGK